MDEHQLGKLKTCLVPEPLHGQMVREPSTLTTAAVLLMALVDAHPLGRPVEEPLLQEMPLELDRVHLLTVEEETAGAQDPRLLLGECLHQLQELAATIVGDTLQAHQA